MSKLELKIPPPLVALLAALAMLALAGLGRPLGLPFVVRVPAAVLLACMGAALGVAGIVSFRRAKTTLDPTHPDKVSTLVTGGVFGRTRNPMYLSLLLYLCAWAIYLRTWPPLLVLPAFVLYMDRFQIKPEERALSARFGPEYAAYHDQVPRWL
jgi:protein-S-isoprenylcysteine O-methyltransferase Ste14